MSDKEDGSEIAEAAAACFANDGELELDELNRLVALALRDNEISEAERRALGDVICRLTPSNVTPVVWRQVQEISRRHRV